MPCSKIGKNNLYNLECILLLKVLSKTHTHTHLNVCRYESICIRMHVQTLGVLKYSLSSKLTQDPSGVPKLTISVSGYTACSGYSPSKPSACTETFSMWSHHPALKWILVI